MRRRLFLAAGAAAVGGALLIRLRAARHALPAGPPTDAPFHPNAYLRVSADGAVLLRIGQTELGQGVHTALAILVAEQLDVHPAAIRVETAADDPAYANPLMGRQRTAWSASVRGWWTPLRQAAAEARARLVAEAAARWRVTPDACRTRDGRVHHPDGTQQFSYGELAAGAHTRRVGRVAPRPVPRIGAQVGRLDAAAKTTGQARYAADIADGPRLIAAVLHAEQFTQTVQQLHDAAARALPGVTHIVPMDGAVGVLASDTWTARRAAALLQVQWSASPPPVPAPEVGAGWPAPAPLRAPAGSVRVSFDCRTAPLLHAQLEPVACSARWTATACTVWVATQDHTSAREAAARAAGLPPEAITLHTPYAGGAFGRGVDTRIVREAVTLARAAPGVVVRLQWSREADTRFDPVREPSAHRLAAGLLGGRIVAWAHAMRGGSGGGAAAALPYEVGDRQITWQASASALPTGLWRAVDGGPACFAMESLMNVCAATLGDDPIAFRLRHLRADSRPARVLQQLHARAGHPLPPGTAEGVALHEQTGSWCAVCARVQLVDGTPVVRALTAVVDGGRIVHPDGARAQVEGALLMGLSSTLREATGATPAGQPSARMFVNYPVLRFPEAPELTIEFVEGASEPGGLGEVALPPVAPAVAAAVAALRGERPAALPLFSSLGA